MKRLIAAALACTLLIPSLFIGADPKPRGDRPDPGLNRLQNAHRDVIILREDDRSVVLSGAMMAGDTAQEAADTWLTLWSDALGVEPRNLVPTRVHTLADGLHTVFAYSQTLAGHPVEGSTVIILVRNTDGFEPNRVIHVGAKLSHTPVGGFPIVDTESDTWFDSLRTSQSFGSLQKWSPPELVILDSMDDLQLEEPILAWKTLAHNDDPADFEAFTLFVDATSGQLVHLRDEVYHVDIQGKVTGQASPGTYPDSGTNPPVSHELSNTTVSVSGGGSTKSAANGDYVLAYGGSSPVTVESVLSGDWVRAFNASGSELALSQVVTPPGPANFEFNASPTEATTAQVNGFYHATATHDFYKDRNPGFTGLDFQIPCNVNLASNCNAYYTTADHSINFYSAGAGCVNTAYSSVVAHEYGHFIVNRLGLSQGAFGEGFGDVIGMLMYDDSIVGRDFIGPGSYVRDTVAANVQYPCSGEIHYCGQLLSGVWWDLRDNLVTALGSENGRDVVQQLFVDWSAITIGGSGTNSAHATTAIEVLTVDDDDGDLGNGTPHFAEICAAFDAHSIGCPDLASVLFSYPDGAPSTLAPEIENRFRVHVTANQGAPVADTGRIVYRINGGDFVTSPMEQGHPNEYTATLSELECFDEVEFYVEVDLAAGGSATDPSDAPASLRSATAVTGEVAVFTENFEGSQGWTVENGGVSGGAWERGIPSGDGSRGDPVTDYDGSGRCFVTENGAGNTDVDGGPTIIVSPAMDFSGGDGTIRYAYWMYNDDGDDALEVSLSNDNGGTWTVAAEHIGGNGGWATHMLSLSDWVTPSDGVRIRFSIADAPNNSITEAAVDAVIATAFTCDGITDCNENGIPDDQDIGEGSSFDCNENGVPDECDLATGASTDQNSNGIPDECEDFVVFCGVPSVNEGCGPVENILQINDSAGGDGRRIEVSTTTPVRFSIQEPTSRAGDGRITRLCLYLWDQEPTSQDLVELPKNLGSMCFGPFYLATAVPEVIFNSLGGVNRLGEHTAAGDPPVIPDGGSVEFLAWPEGFGSARSFTIQGVVQDECSPGQKRFSVTNGIVLRIE